MNYKISFCIPTYNRAKVIKKIVDNLLGNKNPNFQVVVSDNGSIDETMDILQKYNDPRLKICSNNYKGNNLALSNWFNSLENGDGEWLYFIIGRDKVHSAYIDKLINICSQLDDNIGVLLDRYEEEYYDKIDILNRFCIAEHPSGMIFKKKYYKLIKNRKNFFLDTDFVWPEIYLKSEMLKICDGKIIYSGVFKIGEPLINYKKDKSKLVLACNYTNVYFSFASRIKQSFQVALVLTKFDTLTSKEKREIINLNYSHWLYLATLALKIRFADEAAMAHYGLETRHITKLRCWYNCIIMEKKYLTFLKNNKKMKNYVDWKKCLCSITYTTLKQMKEILKYNSWMKNI